MLNGRFSIGWNVPALLVSAAVAVPLVVVLAALVSPPGPAWAHLKETVLAGYLLNSLNLMVLTGLFAAVFGVTSGWLVGACEFPGRRPLSWLLMLPLAAPAYVVAYAYTDLLEVSGPLQTALRAALALTPEQLQLPPIRTLPGAALLLSLVLYPYVYLLSRNSFASRSGVHFQAARVLGASPAKAFFRVSLPAARPAIAGGVALVLMETLADFGVVEYFSVPTLSTGLYRTWIGLGEKAAALKLAAVMLLFVLALVGLERWGRRGEIDRSDLSRPERIPLTSGWAAGAVAFCLALVCVGFLVPVTLLGYYALTTGDVMLGRGFTQYLGNSLSVATGAAALCTGVALLLSYSQRLAAGPVNAGLIQIATLGYALPGILLAVALLGPLGSLDRWISGWWPWHDGSGLLLSGTVVALLYAYVCRFLTVAFQTVNAGMESISPDLDAAARSLGSSPGAVVRRVHWPLLRPSLAASLLLVFVDVMRELPATLLLRPFNFDTLATRVYRLASDERLNEAATAALCIVAAGILPVLLLNRVARSREN
ncbi:MAG: iron ABC transporter permease [Pseudomonadota bacterium]